MAISEKVRFYWQTMLGSSGSTLTATSTASGYSVNNLYNMLEIYTWKAANTNSPVNINLDLGAGNTATADYFIVFGHNLFTAGAKGSLWCSSDNFGSDIVQAGSYVTPSANKTILHEFTAPTARRYWRFVIESTGGGAMASAPYAAIIIWGNKTELKRALLFDPHEEEIKANVVKGPTGYVLGVHDQYRERRMDLRFTNVDDATYQKLKAWWDGSGLKNFFVAWDRGNYSDDVFLMMPDPRFRNPFIHGGTRREVNVSLTGRREDV